MNYNKEEVMKQIFESEPMQRLMNAEATLMATGRLGSYKGKQTTIEVFSTVLDSAYKAGEEKVKNKIKECVNTCSDDISYLDSNSNNECIRIFKVNLEALK